MNLLITNDDSIKFAGLIQLVEVLQELGNVYTFAPMTEKSGTSQALSIHEDVYVEVLDSNRIMVEGYPVDCINIGLHGGLSPTPDLVISGINKGVNMGEDVLYSGTVGAARHAYVHGYPAIAISCGHLDEHADYKPVAFFLRDFVLEHSHLLAAPILLNINYPTELNRPRGIKWTKLGRRIYRDSYQKTLLNGGGYYFNLGGSELRHTDEPNTDFTAYEEGFISVTPLKTDGTDYEQLEISKKESFFSQYRE